MLGTAHRNPGIATCVMVCFQEIDHDISWPWFSNVMFSNASLIFRKHTKIPSIVIPFNPFNFCSQHLWSVPTSFGVWVSNTWDINWAHTLARLDWGCRACKHAASQGATTKICAPCTVELCRVLLGLGLLSRVKVAASLYAPLWSLQELRCTVKCIGDTF